MSAIDEDTGLPTNSDGTVNLYHHTNPAAASQIMKTGRLKSAGEPHVYATTHKNADTGYGSTPVPIRVHPSKLEPDDEFPNGRKDYRISVGRPGGSIPVGIGHPTAPTAPNPLAGPRPAKAEGGGIKRGSKLHTGPIHSTVAGRTDHLPMHVPSGAYVLTADCVSHLGQNNTANGFKNVKRMFSGIPRGQGSSPYGQSKGPYGMMASGGDAGGHDGEGVPIVAAGGEYVLHPDEVRWAGGGDLDTGHKVLDLFQGRIRADMIKTLKGLAKPKKN